MWQAALTMGASVHGPPAGGRFFLDESTSLYYHKWGYGKNFFTVGKQGISTMEYSIGSVGRIFTIRFDDGDDILQGIKELAGKEGIAAGWFNMIGGLQQAEVVTGPKKTVMPPEPVWAAVDGAREVVAVGSLFQDQDGEPRIHLHAALGHHGETMTACVRKGTKTYLILEVYLIEITGVEIRRPWYPPGGFFRLDFP